MYRSIHTCQPVPRSVVQWRHVQYQRHNWQPLLDERVSLVTDVATATRSWQLLIADVTGCPATERVVPGVTFGDDSVLITDTDDPSSPTAIVRIGRVLVEVVLWDGNFQKQRLEPSAGQIADVVTTAHERIRTNLPDESATG